MEGVTFLQGKEKNWRNWVVEKRNGLYRWWMCRMWQSSYDHHHGLCHPLQWLLTCIKVTGFLKGRLVVLSSTKLSFEMFCAYNPGFYSGLFGKYPFVVSRPPLINYKMENGHYIKSWSVFVLGLWEVLCHYFHLESFSFWYFASIRESNLLVAGKSGL